MIDLSGKTVLVTGGSRGIGAATVRKVVACGGAAVIHYGSNAEAAEKLAAEIGTENCHVVQADLLEVDQTERLWDQALAWRGRIDVLVNNAGVYEKCPLDLPLDDWLAGWERTMRINLGSAAQLCRRAIPHFTEKGGGIVINVSSRAGHRGDSIKHQQYGASKAGMLALNRSIARTCAKDNILAYGIAPGFVDTEMVGDIMAEQGLEKMAALYPTGRVTTANEVASVITFLASGVAPQTTGNTIDLCGAADVR
ncbi:MAG: SDR family oxidoreductase [Alphaproteobacteria bacterium]|nr:SDR family oxidoreductase [Alphaproteobacteria bacterium]